MEHPKTTLAGLSSSALIVLCYLLKQLHIEIPIEVQLALVTLSITAVGFLAPDKKARLEEALTEAEPMIEKSHQVR